MFGLNGSQIYASFFSLNEIASQRQKCIKTNYALGYCSFFFTLFLKPLAIFNLRDKKTKLSIKRKLDQEGKKPLSSVQIVVSLLISEFEAWSDSKTMFDNFPAECQ